MREDRYLRHWHILSFVLSSRGKTLGQIQRHLKDNDIRVSTRTVRRDLQMLQGAGFPIYTSKESHGTVWRICEGFQNIPPVPISLLQAFALIVAERSFCAAGNDLLANQLRQLLSELQARHTPDFAQALKKFETGVLAQALLPGKTCVPEGACDVLLRAIQKQVKVHADYRNAQGKVSKGRLLAPLQLVWAQHQLYLAAYCYTRRCVRWFRFSRFGSVRETKESFEPRAEWLEEIKRHTSTTIGIFPAEPEEIELEIDDVLRNYFEENPLHTSQQITRTRGSTRVHLRVGINESLLHDLMGFGPRVRVVKPEKLAYLLVDRHHAAAEFQKELLENGPMTELELNSTNCRLSSEQLTQHLA